MSGPNSPIAGAPPSTPAEGVKFTEREEQLLKVAWACMKSTPEIDIKKFKEAGHFNTDKTCSNTWGALKKKLAVLAQENGFTPITTPKKDSPQKASPKKRAKGSDNEDGAEFGTPSKPKKARKGSVKEELVNEESVKKETAEEEDATIGSE